jgi:hypothetical protein
MSGFRETTGSMPEWWADSLVQRLPAEKGRDEGSNPSGAVFVTGEHRGALTRIQMRGRAACISARARR